MIIDEKKMKKLLDNDDFLDRTKPNVDVGKPTQKFVMGATPIVVGIHKFRDAISAHIYQTDHNVQGIIGAQASRIEETLDEIEGQLAKMDFKATTGNANKKFANDYKRLDLQKEWAKWIEARADQSAAKIADWLKKHKGLLQDREGSLRAMSRKRMSQQKEADLDFVIDLIGDAVIAYNRAIANHPWENPLDPNNQI